MCRCVAGMSNHLSHHHRYEMTLVILETPFAGAFVSNIFCLSLSSPAASFVSTLQGWVISFQHHRSRLMSVSVAWSHISLQTIIHYTDNRNRRRCRTSLSCESYLFLIQQQNMRSVHLRCGVKKSLRNDITTRWWLVKYPRVCYMRSSPQRLPSRRTTEGGTSSTRLCAMTKTY